MNLHKKLNLRIIKHVTKRFRLFSLRKQITMDQINFFDLVEDVQVCILNFVHSTDIINLHYVCLHLKKLISSRKWQHIYIIKNNVEELALMKSRYPFFNYAFSAFHDYPIFRVDHFGNLRPYHADDSENNFLIDIKLQKISQCHTVDLENIFLTDTELQKLSECHLVRLKKCETVSDDDYKYLSKCHTVELYDSRIDDDGLRHFAKCNIVRLSACHRITVAGLQYLKDCESVILYDCSKIIDKKLPPNIKMVNTSFYPLVEFVSTNGSIRAIPRIDIDKYPYSILGKLYTSTSSLPCKTHFSANTMSILADVYRTNQWKCDCTLLSLFNDEYFQSNPEKMAKYSFFDHQQFNFENIKEFCANELFLPLIKGDTCYSRHLDKLSHEYNNYVYYYSYSTLCEGRCRKYSSEWDDPEYWHDLNRVYED